MDSHSPSRNSPLENIHRTDTSYYLSSYCLPTYRLSSYGLPSSSLLFPYFVTGGGIGSLGTREVLLRGHRDTYAQPVHEINPGVVLPGDTAIFLRFPVGATN